MNKIFQHILLILFLVSFTGCTKYWYCQDKSYSQCKTDFRDCRIEACNYFDENDESLSKQRIKYEEKCMKEKGYHLVSEDSLPLQCRRRAPDPVYREKYGIAGPLAIEIETDSDTSQ